MYIPPVPENEGLRQAAMDAINLLHSPAEERFDRITRLAARALGVPIALVSLVGESCQWFKSRVGLLADQTPRAISFCGHAVAAGRPLLVPDARLDPRFHDNPLVLGPPYIRFYAGVPLSMAAGLSAGTLCVIDTVPREFSDSELAMLIDLAAMAEHEMQYEPTLSAQQILLSQRDQSQRRALLDPLTGAWNRSGFEALLQAEAAFSRQQQKDFALLLLEVEAFPSEIAQECERVLVAVAASLRRALRPSDAVSRLGEATFGLMLSPCDAATLAQARRNVVLAARGAARTARALAVSVGGALVQGPHWDVAAALVTIDHHLRVARFDGLAQQRASER
ncbi:GAF domain-containing protein [Paludibacterium yongneupense]|uniref:GAF domain-containing protein n=1 Tax=Paludibacterium yongneupense TaxID=400061 RepID=UPI00040EA645|nr:GAF domain-containing protein [Paludibacterium yongneupense]